MSVGMGSDHLCHLPKPKAGYHRWYQHSHLCVGDRTLQGEGQITNAQAGKDTTAKEKKITKLINTDNSCWHPALYHLKNLKLRLSLLTICVNCFFFL